MSCSRQMKLAVLGAKSGESSGRDVDGEGGLQVRRAVSAERREDLGSFRRYSQEDLGWSSKRRPS